MKMFNEGERKSYFSLIRFDLIIGKYIIISVENLSDGRFVLLQKKSFIIIIFKSRWAANYPAAYFYVFIYFITK